VEKGGSTGKREVQTLSDKSRHLMAIYIWPQDKANTNYCLLPHSWKGPNVECLCRWRLQDDLCTRHCIFFVFCGSLSHGHLFKGGSRIHVFNGKKNYLVKFNFVEKGGSTGKREVQTLCDKSPHLMAICIWPEDKANINHWFHFDWPKLHDFTQGCYVWFKEGH
jgi:hypothetical protein